MKAESIVCPLMPRLAYGGQATSSSNISAFFAFKFNNGDRAFDLALPIEGEELVACTVGPVGFGVVELVLRAESLPAVDIEAFDASS